ncbi:MAG: S8 family serine peptidase [Pseudomonadota bacterium]
MTITAAPEGRFGAAFEWLGVERAWTRTRGSSAVVIGIIDAGVQSDHPLLGPNIHRDVAPPPVRGEHEIAGTHAAGVAAGRSSDVERFSGVAPGARILPVRLNTGAGPQALDLPQAIEYAVEMGACIINIAPGGELTLPAVRRAIQYAAARNVLVVCAASEQCPAPLAAGEDDPVPNQIAVLSVDESGKALSGIPASGADLAAPGFAHVPTWRGSGHTRLMNAAIGAPYVSGCAALLKTLNPGWGYHELKEHLAVSGSANPDLAGVSKGGRMLNVADAVLGPIELTTEGPLTWSPLNDAVITWRMRYASALCVNAAALFKPHGDEHWRELAFARAGVGKMTIPAAALRRASGLLRVACRESNFRSDEVAVTIR